MPENSSIAPDKNLLEWTVFAVSLMLVAGLLGYLSYQAFTQQTHPPELHTSWQAEPGEQHQNRYRIRVTNKGGQTAENVKLQAILKPKGGPEQHSALDLPFCPKRSEREGWVVFEGEPQPGDSLRVRVVSYKKP